VQFKFSFLLLILSAIILGACGQKATEVPTAIPTDTPVPLPTLTATPDTPLAILVVPAEMDPATSSLYQTTVFDLSQASGYRFQVRNTLAPTDLSDPTLKIVIVFPPDPGLATFAAAAPQAQFLAVNVPDAVAGGNVSVLSNSGQVDIPAFLAGYVAAMITPDYHIGMIIPKDDPDALRALEAFTNGMTFYCGLCRPYYFVNWNYPQYIEIPSDEEPGRYGAYADYLILQREVDTLYVYPEIATSDLLTYIGTTGALSMGVTSPIPRPAGWVMTLQPDTLKAIQSAWPNLVAGQGGVNVQSPLGLTDIDGSLLTEGKKRLVEQTLLELIEGRISTGAQ
jgi:hypothetical protein